MKINPFDIKLLKEKKKISIMSTTPATNKKILVTGTPNTEADLLISDELETRASL
jgi:hypothetical protein